MKSKLLAAIPLLVWYIFWVICVTIDVGEIPNPAVTTWWHVIWIPLAITIPAAVCGFVLCYELFVRKEG